MDTVTSEKETPMTALEHLRTGHTATLTGDIRTVDVTNGLDGDHPDFGVLPDGEALVTLHVRGLPDVAPAGPNGYVSYAKVYSEAYDIEANRGLKDRTRFVHDVAADTVAVHAMLDIALKLEEAGHTDAAEFARAHASTNPENSSIAQRHNAARYVAGVQGPAYAAWVQRNSEAVRRRLDDFVDEQTAQVLLAHFHISRKEL